MPIFGINPIAGNTVTQPIDRLQSASAASFDTLVLKAKGPVAVEFMSYGCIHCRKAEPFVQEVAGQLAGQVKMIRVNVPSQPALASKYGIEGTPTFVMFLNGEEVGRAEGPSPSTASILAAVKGPFGS